MTSISNLFLTKGNEKNRDAYCISLFEKAWKKAESERRIPGAEEVNKHLILVLGDVIEPEDFKNIARLREAIGKWEFTKGLQTDQRRQLAIIQLILLTEIFDTQYQELLQAVRVRELACCCDDFIRKREKKLSKIFTAHLSEINTNQIMDGQLKLEVHQYQAVLSMQSVLHTENTDAHKVSMFSRTFNACRSILEASTDSLCIQFIKKVLDLLPTALASHFGFFKTETQRLAQDMRNLSAEEEPREFIYS